MNPCPCGFFGEIGAQECTCTQKQLSLYEHKISGPIFDRFDLCVRVNRVPFEKLDVEGEQESSKIIRERVIKARNIQLKRYDYGVFKTNAGLSSSHLSTYCSLEPNTKKLLRAAIETSQLSARSYTRILRVARTIADLAASEQIKESHLAEAIQYHPKRMLR
jgi:magnesium chelatase family protein